jgi:diaminohydroxyphosphoribosylaminopyrimidine deaminase/5-amino-6-(5-phosphoribosylamino)uracil reductase
MVRLYSLSMISDKQYMQRCIDLALKGAGYVSPNPMVGAVLVHNGLIIGEGWHQQYGQAHAEVNCIASVKEEQRLFIPQSTLYVSLEPCAHYGKTPPCADLIIQHNIPKVVIGCVDSFNEVSGKGIEKLKQAGIEVVLNVLGKECQWLNRRFFCKQEKNRPYIILKWAESDNGYIAPPLGHRVMLSNVYSQKWVHKMRSEEDAILIGFQTALLDNPRLNNRFGTGKNPVRVVIDLEASLPPDLHIFDQTQPTIIFNFEQNKETEHLKYIKLDEDEDIALQLLQQLSYLNSIIIEGGSKTLQLFIDMQLWDEAFIIKTTVMIDDGVPAPTLPSGNLIHSCVLEKDTLNQYINEYPRKL